MFTLTLLSMSWECCFDELLLSAEVGFRLLRIMVLADGKVEDSLCSRVRLRILKVLIEFHTLTPSQIAAELGINYVLVRQHLNALEDSDVLTHVSFGNRIRHYKLKDSPRANAVKNFIEAWSCRETNRAVGQEEATIA